MSNFADAMGLIIWYVLFLLKTAGEIVETSLIVEQDASVAIVQPFHETKTFMFIVRCFLTVGFQCGINKIGLIWILDQSCWIFADQYLHCRTWSVGVIQTFFAAGLFGEIVTSNRWMGILLTLFGSIFYTWTRHQESAAEHKYELSKSQDEENAMTNK